MKESDKKFIKNWEETKKKGFQKYVFSHGLAFGVTLGVANLVMMYIDPETSIDFENIILKSLAIIISAGLIYSLTMWYVNHYIYRQKIKK